MYINMTPDKTNKTLHASQDDTNRQFKFKLVNDSQVLDTSDSIPPVIYDVEPNGIEQLLPVNSSTPTTSPIIADIQYPDELRENQEFFERIIPTTLKGQAKVKKIKGNTIVWNQLVQNGNFVDTTGWSLSDSVQISVSNGILTATIGSTHHSSIRLTKTNLTMVSGKKYLFMCDIKPTKNTNVRVQYPGVATDISTKTMTANVWGRYSSFVTMTANNNLVLYYNTNNILDEGDTVQFRNCVLFDLSLMGLDNLTSVSDFTNLFPLPYYDYNVGSLLSFNGIGIKTTGKNLLSYSGENLPYNANGVSITRQNNIYKVVATNPSGYPFARISTINYLPKGTYTVLMLGAESSNTGIAWRLIDRNVSPVRTIVNSSLERAPFTINEDLYNVYFEITIDANRLSAGTWNVRFALEKGQQTDYEPYTENTIDLPISTYFPTGMKSAGSIYDELTESKAITRVGSVDMSTLEWTKGSSSWNTLSLASIIKRPANNEYPQLLCSGKIVPVSSNNDSGVAGSYEMFITSSTGQIRYRYPMDDTEEQFINDMSGVYLYYEIATPTEEDIESCSLVSEDIEKPLEYDNGFLVCDSEGLTTKSGFIPCKVKMVKGDKTLYSQLINLHVERKP